MKTMIVALLALAFILVLALCFVGALSNNIFKVQNKKRRFGSANEYTVLKINNEILFFTSNEIKIARKRAQKNKEDLAN